MPNTLIEAAKGGLSVAAILGVVGVFLAAVLGPLVLVVAYALGWLSFETTVLALLVLALYLPSGGE